MEKLFVFQGGGPTAVINATLSGVLDAAHPCFSNVFGLRHSLEHVATTPPINLTDLTAPSAADDRARLARTPGALLGSSRTKVTEAHLSAVLDVMQAEGARHILGIGGNGTMHALNQLAEFAASRSVDLNIVGAPKTVDNDLPGAAFAPGYGSAARFVALATRDFDFDFRAMQTFDDVTILETMGRDTGWLAAASVLLKEADADAPHIVLIPERPVDEAALLKRVSELHRDLGRVFIVTNEVLTAPDGTVLGQNVQDGPTDSLGRTMYSLSTGTGNYLAQLIWKQLGLQARCLRPGSLGRALTSCVSEVDFELALRAGRATTDLFDRPEDGAKMLTIAQDLHLGWQPTKEGIGRTPLPKAFFDQDDEFAIGLNFATMARSIIGEVSPLFHGIRTDS
ncbi:6-phosphofructokinase [Octadecabacter ascidiaceicola]|uniref:6-phosphofructokinase 1 n=1 Tax=Octadecabacter ascidiaceicola TaxID=1655543 RepID=A0A238K9E8_9RHOB|nr:6-phosphofructokinase [Octadecabacter ascidiaceicola]SMX39541.1 6-phosphofructokinase 1 [Octadecabacter ascidiaceicola]